MSKTLFHKGREQRERLLRALVPCPMSPAEACRRRQVRERLAKLAEERQEADEQDHTDHRKGASA